MEPKSKGVSRENIGPIMANILCFDNARLDRFCAWLDEQLDVLRENGMFGKDGRHDPRKVEK